MNELTAILIFPGVIITGYFFGRIPLFVAGGAAAGLSGYLALVNGGGWAAACFAGYLAGIIFAAFHIKTIKSRESAICSVAEDYSYKIEQLKAGNQDIKNQISGINKNLDKTLQFYTLTKGVADTADYRRMISMIENAIKKFMASREYAVYLLDLENTLKLVAKQGKWDNTITAQIKMDKPALYNERSFIKSQAGSSNILCLPFVQKSELYGVILVRTQENKITDMPDVEQVWGLLSLGMMRSRIYWNMETESLTDGLTKLLRRNYFEERLKELVKRASFFNTSFGLTLIDLDHFKQINDTYGHQAGDEILKKVSQILQANIYETDLLGRWGGEEFICVFPRSDPQGLYVKADKIRRSIENEVFSAGLEQLRLSISIGIAHFPRDASSMQELVHAADQALYRAKEAGRNRVVDYRQS